MDKHLPHDIVKASRLKSRTCQVMQLSLYTMAASRAGYYANTNCRACPIIPSQASGTVKQIARRHELYLSYTHMKVFDDAITSQNLEGVSNVLRQACVGKALPI